MEADFIDRMQQIRLTEEEGEVLEIRSTNRDKTLEECSLSLVGRFLSTRPYNMRAAKATIRAAWKLGSDVRIIEMGEGILQFKFTLESQLLWVLNNGPWSFDNNLLVLRRWERGMTARSVTFSVLPIWVQVWGLPFDLINEEAAWDIGKGLGHVVEVDNKTFSSEQARFIRIRVEILLHKPIRRGGYVLSPEGDRVRVGFKYERMVGLCYQCGLFGHDAKECPNPKDQQLTENPYGEWLKAGQRKSGETPDRRRNSSPRWETRQNHDQGCRDQPQSMSVTAPGGNNDPNGKNGELGNGTINDTVSQQHINVELMGTEITENNQTLKESIKAVASKLGEVTDKELTPSEAINPMIATDELVNVHVQYVEVIKPTPNHAAVDQNLIPRAAAREIIKTQEIRPTENTAKWKRIECHNDHPMSITNIGSHQTGVKRA
nr:uncharacterized protein CFP56_75213 [Quercus suber]